MRGMADLASTVPSENLIIQRGTIDHGPAKKFKVPVPGSWIKDIIPLEDIPKSYPLEKIPRGCNPRGVYQHS